MKERFAYLPNYGWIEIETVIFESYFPMLFICKSKKKHRFVCVCCRANEKEKAWIISEILIRNILRLLKDDIDIRGAFTIDGMNKYYLTKSNRSGCVLQPLGVHEWDDEKSQDLPAGGEFLDAEDGEFKDEILFYNKELIKEALEYAVSQSIKDYLKKEQKRLIREESIPQTININPAYNLVSADRFMRTMPLIPGHSQTYPVKRAYVKSYAPIYKKRVNNVGYVKKYEASFVAHNWRLRYGKKNQPNITFVN